MITRMLAGVGPTGRPVFLKMVYHGPKAMEELVRFDPHLVVGILGGSAGTTRDAFQLLHDAQKYGAKVALFGRKINNAENQLAFVHFLRLIVEGQVGPVDAVKAYHAVLGRLGLRPHRSLEADLAIDRPGDELRRNCRVIGGRSQDRAGTAARRFERPHRPAPVSSNGAAHCQCHAQPAAPSQVCCRLRLPRRLRRHRVDRVRFPIQSHPRQWPLRSWQWPPRLHQDEPRRAAGLSPSAARTRALTERKRDHAPTKPPRSVKSRYRGTRYLMARNAWPREGAGPRLRQVALHKIRIPDPDARRRQALHVGVCTQGHKPALSRSCSAGRPTAFSPTESTRTRSDLGPSPLFGTDGYIVVYQDVRGRWMSEGEFVNMRPHKAQKASPTDIDESTDTFDTIDWLLKHVPNHNGRVGMWGISYPGFYTAAGMIDAHPALKAASPQAPVTDWFTGDDWHHNGAFQLPHAFNFLASFGHPRPEPTKKSTERFDHGTPDGYAFFLKLGPLANVNMRYFKNDVPFWNEIMQHGTFDQFWQDRNLRPHLKNIKPAVMTVGGWFDAENLFGALETYKNVEAMSPGATNVLGDGALEPRRLEPVRRSQARPGAILFQNRRVLSRTHRVSFFSVLS